MSIRKSLLQLSVCLLSAVPALAQTPTTVPAGQKLGTENSKSVTGVRILPQADGTVWFLVPSNDRIVQLQADGVTMKQWQIRQNKDLGANPVDLKVDGKFIWFIENGESLIDAGRSIFARLNTETGELREWDVPGSRPAAFYLAPDGKVWLPQTNGRLQSLDLNTLDVVDYRSTKTFAYSDMVVGPDGALWMTDFGDNRIVRYVPGAAEETSWTFADPTTNPRFNPSQIRFDEDGKLWISMLFVSEMSRFDPATGEMSSFFSFINPIHFDLFGGRVYVAEAPAANGRIVVLDPALATRISRTLTPETLTVGAVPNALKAKVLDSTITPTTFTSTAESFASADLVTTNDAPGYLRTVFPSNNAYGMAVAGGTVWVGSDGILARLVLQTIGSDSDLMVPVAAEFGVSPGVRITTDATLYNRGSGTVSGELLYLYSPAAFAARTAFSVDPGKTLRLADVFSSISSNAAVYFGPVRIRVTSGNPDDLLASVRSARQGDDGSSFGFASPAANSAGSVNAGATRALFTGSRSSEVSVFGVFTPGGASATAKLMAPDGTLRGQRTFKLAANISLEFNPASKAFGMPPEPGDVILVTVTSGALQPYVNVLDTGTSDVAISLPLAATADAVIPDLGTLTGAGDTSYISDLLLANPDPGAAASFTISYLPLGTSGPPTVVTRALAPGASEVIQNVLGTLFGITAGQGTVLVASNTPLAVSTRIAARRDNGDYAGFAPALNGGERIPDSGTVLAFGVPETAYRRTHLFLYNRGSAGTATIVGYDSGGNEVGRMSVDIAAGQGVRINSVMARLGVSDQAAGSLTVTAAPGMALFAQTAEVDAVTGDVEVSKLR